jgi:peptidoglycan/xylan/chitin deacetylase (PgdA/CDA1 family)
MSNKGLVTFTFDDGISNNTEELLDILDSEKITATFFIIGESLGTTLTAPPRAKLKAIHDKGHIVGNHTHSHPNIVKLSQEDLRAEIAGANAEIRATIDHKMKYFRPPYGSINASSRKFITDMGFRIVLWDLDPRDWDVKRSKEDMLDYYTSSFHHADPKKSSYIILQHDRRKDSIQLVPDIAKIVRDKGFKIVSLDEYYEESKPTSTDTKE